MLEVTITDQKTETWPELPCLMERVGYPRMVVLFFDETYGVVVNQGHSDLEVGSFDKEFLRYTDKNSWRPFTGTITLRNG